MEDTDYVEFNNKEKTSKKYQKKKQKHSRKRKYNWNK